MLEGGVAWMCNNVYFSVPEVLMIDTQLANRERFSPSTIETARH